MTANSSELFLEAARKALDEADLAKTDTEKARAIRNVGICLRAGLGGAFALCEVMEGVGASPMAREISFQMVMDGEI